MPANLAGLDLNLLVALHALLEEHNVTRAGQRIGLSQSAMSGALARLRTLLDDPLLVRAGRGLQLSPRARTLVEPVRALMERIQRVLSKEQAFDAASDRRRFVLAISDYCALLLMPHLLAMLEREAPMVTLDTNPLHLNTLERLDGGKIDAALWAFDTGSRHASQVIFRDRWVCAMWAGAPDLPDGLTRQAYNRLPHLGVPLAPGYILGSPDLFLERTGLQRNVRATATSLLVAPFLLRGTPLVAFLPQRLAMRWERLAELRLLDPPIDPLELEYRLTWSHAARDDTAHKWLRSKIEAAARALDEADAVSGAPRRSRSDPRLHQRTSSGRHKRSAT